MKKQSCVKNTMHIIKYKPYFSSRSGFVKTIDWLVDCFGLNGLLNNTPVYIGPSPREREKKEKNYGRAKKCPNNHHPHLVQAK